MSHKQVQAAPQVAQATQQPKAHRAWLIAMLIACASASQTAQAAGGDADTERENLARIDAELERVQVMVKEAAERAPSGQRVKFRYDWLLQDLQLLRKGVADHVDAPRQPRPVPPLRGDYRQ
ncbi:MAG: RAQPRD family integrative conjugative element protein [Hydrogenophaga sp.]|jgi:RAQPRD family integrative conjugative element protein|uniref:integrative conjugative element protein, RAQPRD family n=1 Tax=Hydrogenophaga sp. TaxID=1904254 RepID=UPI002AB93B62|nr:RAQPRD family integrative conjugative element protein [Hydrogenophaga sp.]MDZ4175207.1 RAQPRD family integrative conjugative element protein [Hydrogenophaga sp.]